jgi:hypothetical protein
MCVRSAEKRAFAQSGPDTGATACISSGRRDALGEYSRNLQGE